MENNGKHSGGENNGKFVVVVVVVVGWRHWLVSLVATLLGRRRWLVSPSRDFAWLNLDFQIGLPEESRDAVVLNSKS